MKSEEKIKALFTEHDIKFHPKTGIEKLMIKLEEVADDIPEALELFVELNEEAPEKEVEKPKKSKEITPDSLLSDFAGLIDNLDKHEKDQRKVGKPFRHVFMTKTRLNILMGTFKRMIK